MRDEHEAREARVTRAYREHRAFLVDLAFRMLGEIGAAEDAVQEAFARLLAARVGEIDDERGWLIVVTSRLCLDRIKSAQARREHVHDAAEIEYVSELADDQLADPADRVTLDDSVNLALLVLLSWLSPAERVAFVLHDVFQLPFPAVAQIVGRTAASCRQLAKRARLKIAEGGVQARFEVASAKHRAVTERFIAACATGDLDGLLQVLAADVWGELDPGPDAPVPATVHGATTVAANLVRFWGPTATLVSHPVAFAGHAALLGFRGGRLAGVLVLTLRRDLVQTIHVIGDPRKLRALRLQLSDRSEYER